MSKLVRLAKRLFRAVLVIDGVVMFRSGRATTQWATQHGITMSATSPQSRAKVYVSGVAWLWWKVFGRLEVEAIFVTPLHRLGNAVHQIGNAALVARAIGVTGVVLPRNDTFTTPVALGGDIRLGYHLPRRRRGSVGRTVLVGRFFWDDEFPGVCSPEKIPTALRGVARSVMGKDQVALVSPDTLVIHVRGGDVFSERPSRRYGQPPFAFYEVVISSRDWEKVTVVSEDTHNPVNALIAEYCEKRGIPLTEVSGSLLSDVSVLLGATHLVLASGTFGRTIVVLSDTVQHVYEFERSARLYPLDEGVTHHRVVDVLGGYKDAVLTDNWDNTGEQRRLMVHYPATALSLRTLPATT